MKRLLKGTCARGEDCPNKDEAYWTGWVEQYETNAPELIANMFCGMDCAIAHQGSTVVSKPRPPVLEDFGK